MFDAILNQPMGSLLNWILSFTGSYGIALIIFTIIVKVAVSPLSIIQHKSTIKSIGIRPKEAAIRKKYANDRVKQNEEIGKLYQEEKINPMAGCLPLLIQLPIIIALYGVIRQPLTFVLKFSQETIQKLNQALFDMGAIPELLSESDLQLTGETMLANGMHDNFDALVSQGIFDITATTIDYTFLGIDLSQTPTVAFNLLLLIPLFAGITAYAQSFISMKMQPTMSDPNAPGAKQAKTMMYTMPLISVWFTFTLPAGIGLYWGVSNLVAIIQSLVLNSIWSTKKAYVAAQAKYEAEEKANRGKKKNEPTPVKEDPSLTKYMPKTSIPNPFDED